MTIVGDVDALSVQVGRVSYGEATTLASVVSSDEEKSWEE